MDNIIFRRSMVGTSGLQLKAKVIEPAQPMKEFSNPQKMSSFDDIVNIYSKDSSDFFFLDFFVRANVGFYDQRIPATLSCNDCCSPKSSPARKFHWSI